MPVDRPDNVGVRPTASPDGSLLGWLAVNYPETYAKIANAPRDTRVDYKDGIARKKRRVISPLPEDER